MLSSPSPSRPPMWLLVLITISGTMAMHMFVPALPLMAHEFGATPGEAQLTISAYILGLAAGQLFYGPLSDSFGRRPLLMVGLALYAASGVLAAVAPNVHMLVLARLLQALGGCAGLALGRAMVRDSSASHETLRKLATLNLMIMVGPGLAPMAGSLLAHGFGWRAVFWLLAAVGTVTLFLAAHRLPETADPKGAFTTRTFLTDYRKLLTSRSFVCYALGGGCATTAVYAFIATAPFLFHIELNRPLGEVGFYLGMIVFGLSLGNLMAGRLSSRFTADQLLRVGSALGLLGSLIFLGLNLTSSLSVGWIIGAMLVFTCGAGLSSPVALARAVSVEPALTGSAAGLYGFTQMLVGAICTSLVTIGSNPAMSAACVMVAAVLLAAGGFAYGRSRRTASAPDAR
ncbi:multidrug effflux MFS transporter [Variovorax sp. Sphag1AA]|uniref:multidrug effflux MFS transporter n=1 Tax=Variovorax sp. Sphag1AA TaxID=2587027 RepID=UPI00160F2661|nr:multidrug effflux MFS transporter [Variovorax sp. Sphag1AA]MBB3178015.1 DHA1 family bicyclomycin/chloramphenicol resistance-like MFS transporter [Variovorax sp. Sphag1AA]